jgi:hypothetical protein
MLFPKLSEIPLTGWIMGVVAVTISGILWYLSTRILQGHVNLDQSVEKSTFYKVFTLEWLYRFLWTIFRGLTKLTSLLSTILEGDGGILWAFVLFALIFVFLQR